MSKTEDRETDKLLCSVTSMPEEYSQKHSDIGKKT